MDIIDEKDKLAFCKKCLWKIECNGNNEFYKLEELGKLEGLEGLEELGKLGQLDELGQLGELVNQMFIDDENCYFWNSKSK